MWLFGALSTQAFASPSRLPHFPPRARAIHLPLTFEANRGQAASGVRYFTRSNHGALLLRDRGADLWMPDAKGSKPVAVRMTLAGSNPHPTVSANGPMKATANYLLGKDPKRWRTQIPLFQKVQYRSVYPGVDLVFYGNDRQLEYDFTVAPGAKPDRIRMNFGGVKRMEIGKGGDLILHTPGGSIRQHKPVLYQVANGKRKEIAGGYRLCGKNRVAFRVGSYDRTRPLVIDPVLAYASYWGGEDQDFMTGAGVDAFGNLYVAGYGHSSEFITKNAIQSQYYWVPSSNALYNDIVLAKIDPNGNLVYSTYIGGAGEDTCGGIAVDATGNVYLTGQTDAIDFPGKTVDPKDGVHKLYVMKVNPQGTSLLYSLIYSGVYHLTGTGIAVDANGEAVVSGTEGFFTSQDSFVVKFNADASAVVFRTDLKVPERSDSDNDETYGIALDGAGNAYVVGYTQSNDYPHTDMSLHTGDFVGGIVGDAFVTKVGANGGIEYSSIIGGSGGETGKAITVDANGNAYVAVETLSSDIPTTAGTYQPAMPSPGKTDVYLAKLDPNGKGVFATFLGGNDYDRANAITLDEEGHPWVAGATSSPDFPKVNSLKADFAEGDRDDAYVAELNGDGSQLLFSSTLGGSKEDKAVGVVAKGGSAYLLCNTSSPEFPTQNPFKAQIGSTYAWNGFVMKLTDVGGGGGGVDNVPPLVQDAGVDPAVLPDAGGQIALRAEAADPLNPIAPGAGGLQAQPNGVASMTAQITLNGQAAGSVPLQLDPNGSGEWLGTYTVPANTTGQTQTYSITYVATDAAGNSSTSPGVTVTVAAVGVTLPTSQRQNVELSGGAVTIKDSPYLFLYVHNEPVAGQPDSAGTLNLLNGKGKVLYTSPISFTGGRNGFSWFYSGLPGTPGIYTVQIQFDDATISRIINVDAVPKTLGLPQPQITAPSDGSLDVKWETVAGAMGYSLILYQVADTNYTAVAGSLQQGGVTSWNVPAGTLQAGKNYTVQMQALDFDYRAMPVASNIHGNGLYTDNFTPSAVVTPPCTPGNVNGDKDANGKDKVDVNDAILILKAAVGLTQLDDNQKRAANVTTGDTKIDVNDAILVLKAAVGLVQLPAACS
jgi:hypothetical protein